MRVEAAHVYQQLAMAREAAAQVRPTTWEFPRRAAVAHVTLRLGIASAQKAVDTAATPDVRSSKTPWSGPPPARQSP